MRSPGRQRSPLRARGRAPTAELRRRDFPVKVEPRRRKEVSAAVAPRSSARLGARNETPAPSNAQDADRAAAVGPSEAAFDRVPATSGERKPAAPARSPSARPSAAARAAVWRTAFDRRLVTSFRRREGASPRRGLLRHLQAARVPTSPTAAAPVRVAPRLAVPALTPAGPRPGAAPEWYRSAPLPAGARAAVATPLAPAAATVDRHSRCRRSSPGCRDARTERRARAFRSGRSFRPARTRPRSRRRAARASPDE